MYIYMAEWLKIQFSLWHVQEVYLTGSHQNLECIGKNADIDFMHFFSINGSVNTIHATYLYLQILKKTETSVHISRGKHVLFIAASFNSFILVNITIPWRHRSWHHIINYFFWTGVNYTMNAFSAIMMWLNCFSEQKSLRRYYVVSSFKNARFSVHHVLQYKFNVMNTNALPFLN